MIALEHTLIMLLLLVGLLNVRPKLPAIVQLAVGIGVALALVSPRVVVPLPWDLLIGLTVPLLLWQTAIRLVRSGWVVKPVDILLWSGITVGIALLLSLTTALGFPAALIFGLLVASMIWQATEAEEEPSYLGQLGPLALVFLLAEVAPAVEAPNRYFFAVIGGAGLGAVIGYLAVQAAKQLQTQRQKNILSIGQVYLAYVTALMLGVSGVAAATLSVAFYVSYGILRGLWANGEIRPKPLESPPVFILAVAALAFFGWQTHVPPTPLLLLETGLGLLITAAAIWLGRIFGSRTFRMEGSYLEILVRVGLLIGPALLLWPREALLDPAPLALALIVAGLAAFGTHFGLRPIISLYNWLDETAWNGEQPDQTKPALLVKDLMARDFATVHPETPLLEAARLLTENRVGCLPVLSREEHLVGIVTDGDLFLKEERLPRTDQTYLAVFGIPVKPEQLPAIYAELGASRIVSDVMTQEVVWVKDTHTLGQAIKLMVRMGFKCLPVLTGDPVEKGGKLVGVITRLDLIRLLSSTGLPAENHRNEFGETKQEIQEIQ